MYIYLVHRGQQTTNRNVNKPTSECTKQTDSNDSANTITKQKTDWLNKQTDPITTQCNTLSQTALSAYFLFQAQARLSLLDHGLELDLKLREQHEKKKNPRTLNHLKLFKPIHNITAMDIFWNIYRGNNTHRAQEEVCWAPYWPNNDRRLKTQTELKPRDFLIHTVRSLGT